MLCFLMKKMFFYFYFFCVLNFNIILMYFSMNFFFKKQSLLYYQILCKNKCEKPHLVCNAIFLVILPIEENYIFLVILTFLQVSLINYRSQIIISLRFKIQFIF
jgi:hypothetical protein